MSEYQQPPSQPTDTLDDLSERLAGTNVTGNDGNVMIPELLRASKELVELQSYYVDIVKNMPDDYLQTVQLLERHLSSQHISKLFECSSALEANQTIVTCLVEKATSKADLLDFCETLLSLKNTSRLVSIVESLRKAVMESLQSPTAVNAAPTGQQSLAQNAVPQIDRPQHTCSGTIVQSQPTGEDGHRTTTTNEATGSSMPNTEEPSHQTQDTIAALKTFDEYYAAIESVDPFVFIPKCISYGVFQGDDMYTSGGSIFLNNQMKLEMALPNIRKLISLNGVDVFDKLLKVLHSEPNYKRLAKHMESAYQYHKSSVGSQEQEPQTEDTFTEGNEIPSGPVDSKAALAAFDECFEQMRDCIEIDVLTIKCVKSRILDSSPITGAAIYQPDNEKKNLVLPLIRSTIALNGTPVFLKLVRVLEGMAHTLQLAADLKGALERHQK